MFLLRLNRNKYYPLSKQILEGFILVFCNVNNDYNNFEFYQQTFFWGIKRNFIEKKKVNFEQKFHAKF